MVRVEIVAATMTRMEKIEIMLEIVAATLTRMEEIEIMLFAGFIIGLRLGWPLVWYLRHAAF